ncbi:MAG: oxidoreductase [Gemmatimonadetes bacterium]|nr:oxidoreductase [Gemmatimonadota bacterium]
MRAVAARVAPLARAHRRHLEGAVLAAILGIPSASGAQESSLQARPSARLVESGTDAVLQSVSPVNDDLIWVSGHEGALLRSLDGGATWTSVPSPAGDSLQFRDIKAFSPDRAVILSSGSGPLSRIYRTTDGGRSWTLAFLMPEEDGFLDCLDFWDRDRGFAYGDAIDEVPYVLQTEDGGRTWERVPSSGLPAALPGEGGFAASGTCAVAGDGGQGWIATGAGGSARVLTTTDYGVSWTAADLPVARGAMAGAFTIAAHAGAPVMILGGDLGREDQVVANAIVRSEPAAWSPAETDAPLPGAVYGSAALDSRTVFAFGPRGSAYTADRGVSWIRVPEVEAWAGAWGPGGSRGWAVGTGGRLWVIDMGSGGR